MSAELDKAREASGMTPDRLNEIRALLIGTTPGPWRWFGNTNVHSLYLATVHHGRRFVMQFERWGMRDAAPLFQVKTPNGHGVMVRADELVRYEVPYRKDVNGIDHPDAQLIEAAPSAIADLLAEVDRLTAALAAERARVRGIVQSARHAPCPSCGLHIDADDLLNDIGDDATKETP